MGNAYAKKMKKILITGGAGFIGYHVAVLLLQNPENELVLVDNFFRGGNDVDFKKLCENPRVTFLEFDLTDPAVYEKLGKGYAHVYHLAAVNGTRLFYEIPHEVLRINTLTLVFLLEWFRKYNVEGKLLFASTCEAYAGALEAFGILPIPTPENVPLVIADPYNPRSSYDASKLIGEPFVIHYAKQYGFRAVIMRPHNFYGPRDTKDHVVPDFLERIVERVDPFPIYGAENTRDFTYIQDAVEAMQLLMDSTKTDGQPIETVHIGTAEEISIETLAQKMFAVAGWSPQKIDIHEAPQGSVKRRVSDISKIKAMFGWKPTTSLEEGLKKTYEWYVANCAS